MNDLSNVADDVLLISLKRLTGTANEVTAHLLAHLGEVEARGIHRNMACATLCTYCVYELRMSEDEAQRRCRAARLCRQFPLLFEMLADASIHLTGILLLGPHLTDENHREVLARARYRRKREIEKLVAELAPRADVPARIEPLHVAARPSADHARMMAALCGPVRRLPPGNGRGQAPVGALAERELADESSLSSHPEPEPAPPRPMHYKVEFTAWQRDQGQCTYLDERGRRCRETSMLEYHHEQAWALGGATSVDNIALRCRAHNALAAERDFGRAIMASKRHCHAGTAASE